MEQAERLRAGEWDVACVVEYREPGPMTQENLGPARRERRREHVVVLADADPLGGHDGQRRSGGGAALVHVAWRLRHLELQRGRTAALHPEGLVHGEVPLNHRRDGEATLERRAAGTPVEEGHGARRTR